MATWRTNKKRMIKLSDELNRKGYFENCNYIPCKITSLYPMCPGDTRPVIYSCEVEGEPLMDAAGSCSCSLFSCNPLPLTEKEALERVAYEKEHGRLEYLKKYVYGPLTEEQEKELVDWYNKWGMKI